MTDKIRKERTNFTPDQKLEYAKLMTEEGYTSKQIMEISGAGSTAVNRWKKQYLAEQRNEVSKNKTALDPQLRRIQELEFQLKEAKEDNEILKKATAFFIRDNPALRS